MAVSLEQASLVRILGLFHFGQLEIFALLLSQFQEGKRSRDGRTVLDGSPVVGRQFAGAVAGVTLCVQKTSAFAGRAAAGALADRALNRVGLCFCCQWFAHTVCRGCRLADGVTILQ